MALFDSSTGQLDDRGWTDIVARLGTTVGDLKGAAIDLYGIDSENLILVKVETHKVEEFLMPDDTSIRTSRPGIYSNGNLIVARDARLEDGKSKVAALKAALSEEVRFQRASSLHRETEADEWFATQSKESQVFFSEVGGVTYEHNIVVSSSTSISALTAQVAAVLGTPSDEIKLYVALQRLPLSHSTPAATSVGNKCAANPTACTASLSCNVMRCAGTKATASFTCTLVSTDGLRS